MIVTILQEDVDKALRESNKLALECCPIFQALKRINCPVKSVLEDAVVFQNYNTFKLDVAGKEITALLPSAWKDIKTPFTVEVLGL